MTESADQLEAQARACEASQPDQAEKLYQELLKLEPERANVSFRLGILLHQRGQLEQAADAYQQELALRPQFWACRANLAQLLKENRMFQAALQHCQQALVDCPEPAWQIDLLILAAALLRELGQAEAALKCLEQAEKRHSAPRPELQRELARTCRQLGRSQAARWHYQRALTQGAGPRLQVEAAEYLMSLQRFYDGITIMENLLAQNALPDWRTALLAQIANGWQELNQPERAREAYTRAIEQDPAYADGLRLARSLVLPVVYADADSVINWRQHLEKELKELAAKPLSISNPLDLAALPFYLAYQGQNDRALMELQAQIYRQLDMPGRHQSALRGSQTSSQAKTRTKTQTKTQARLRVGVVSHFFYAHSVMHCFLELLLELGQEEPFELYCFAASPLIEDSVTRELQRVAKGWVRLQGPLEQQAEQIRATELDILLYTDMGLDPHTYLLAQYQLAPRQVILPGHPVTSGLSGFDAFISDQLSEPAGAQEHYTEPLLLLDQPATIYRPPHIPAQLPGRSQLGLSETEHLYLCPGQAFKFHPVMDPLLTGILEADSQARLLLLDLTSNGLIQAVVARLANLLGPEQRRRVTVLPRYAPDAFLGLLAQVDVMLENYPFGSVNTLMAAFAVGTPVVTLPGEYMRGRICQALYRQMDLAGPVAATPAEYIQQAVQLASDSHLRQRLKQDILGRSERLFMNRKVGKNFRQKLLDLGRS